MEQPNIIDEQPYDFRVIPLRTRPGRPKGDPEVRRIKCVMNSRKYYWTHKEEISQRRKIARDAAKLVNSIGIKT